MEQFSHVKAHMTSTKTSAGAISIYNSFCIQIFDYFIYIKLFFHMSNTLIRPMYLYTFRPNYQNHSVLCSDSSDLKSTTNILLFEPVHEISNNVVCATSKASDQPAHMRSLISAFASRLSSLWLLSYWLNIIWNF